MVIKNITPEDIPDELKNVWTWMYKLPESQYCFLCGSNKPRYGGIFCPDKETENLYPNKDVPEGKYRVYGYSLCEECAKKADYFEQVKEKMMGFSCTNKKVSNYTGLLNLINKKIK
jgi:hypothetical protein